MDERCRRRCAVSEWRICDNFLSHQQNLLNCRCPQFHNGENLFEKNFLYPDPDPDEFQNLMVTSLSKDIYPVNFTWKSDQQFYVKSLTDKETKMTGWKINTNGLRHAYSFNFQTVSGCWLLLAKKRAIEPPQLCLGTPLWQGVRPCDNHFISVRWCRPVHSWDICSSSVLYSA